MALTFTIGGQDVLGWVDVPSVTITDGLSAKQDSMRFDMVIPFSDLDAGNVEKPRPGNVVSVAIDGTKEFEGIITTVSDFFLNPEVMRCEVECSDYVVFLDRKLVTKQEYPEQSAGARIKAILEEFCPDFYTDTSYIEDGLTLPPEGYDYEVPSSIFDRISDSTGYTWYVDYDMKVHFFAEENYNSPLDDNLLDLDSTELIGGVEVVEDIANLYNVVIVKDFRRKSDNRYVHDFQADGVESFFKQPFEPWSASSDDVSVSVKPAGGTAFIPRLIAKDPLDGSTETLEGQEGYAYVCVVNEGIRFPTCDLPGEGDIVRFEYNYALPEEVHIAHDLDSIRFMSEREGENSDGEHHVLLSLPDFRVSDIGTLEYAAQLVLANHAWPEIRGSFSTIRVSGWSPGQYMYVTSNVRDIYDVETYAKTGEKIAARVWVTQVTKRIVVADGETRMEYSVSFSNKREGGRLI